MRAETTLELQKKIAEKFEQALGPKHPASPRSSGEERQARTVRYAGLLIKAAMRQSR